MLIYYFYNYFPSEFHKICVILGLSRAQRTLSKSLIDFNFECIGSTQTDDEQVIVDSLKQFGKLIAAIEDERDNMVFINYIYMYLFIYFDYKFY